MHTIFFIQDGDSCNAWNSHLDSWVVLTLGDDEKKSFIVLHKEVSVDADGDALDCWARWQEE